ncbi:MAG TPA: sensor domain-containing protein [Mycobacterium sp.]|nr:sensor domain-containing protein [Mycobacterium sp.]
MADGAAEGHSGLRANRRWIAIGALALITVVALAVILFVRLASPARVTPGQLDSALLDGQQLNTVMGAGGLELGEIRQGPAKPTYALSKVGCLGALTAVQEPTYADSGYTDLRWAQTSEPGDKVDHYVAEGVAIFPDAKQANAFVKNSADQWRFCADQVVTVVQADKSVFNWRLAAVLGVPPKVAISETREDTAWKCQRALRAARNAVVDVTACAAAITDQGRVIGDRVAGNIAK